MYTQVDNNILLGNHVSNIKYGNKLYMIQMKFHHGSNQSYATVSTIIIFNLIIKDIIHQYNMLPTF